MKKRIKRVQEVVNSVLIDHPEARGNDTILYSLVCLRFNRICGDMSFYNVLQNLDAYGLPTLETVGRVRRKLQAQDPTLRPPEAVTEARFQEWKEWREYAQNGIQ